MISINTGVDGIIHPPLPLKSQKRLVFGKQERDDRYIFIGLFDEGRRIKDGIEFNRISSDFDLLEMKPIIEQ